MKLLLGARPDLRITLGVEVVFLNRRGHQLEGAFVVLVVGGNRFQSFFQSVGRARDFCGVFSGGSTPLCREPTWAVGSPV